MIFSLNAKEERVEVSTYTYDEMKNRGEHMIIDEPLTLKWGEVVRVEKVISFKGGARVIRRTVSVIPAPNPIN